MKSMMRYMQLHQKATPVFVLVRSSTFKTSIDNMFRRFALHSKVDPWIKLYVSQYYPKLSEKGLKHYMDMPKFAVKVLTSFNIFGDFRQTTYVADFISQSWHVDVREPYLAEANFIRARRTFSVHKMCLSYFVVMHIEYPKNKPRFTEGDGIKLVPEQDQLACSAFWKGVVVEASAASSWGSVTAIIDRPASEHQYLDFTRLADFEQTDVSHYSADDLQMQVKNKTKKPVTVFRIPQTAEMKRHLNAARSFGVSYKQAKLHPVHNTFMQNLLKLATIDTLSRSLSALRRSTTS